MSWVAMHDHGCVTRAPRLTVLQNSKDKFYIMCVFVTTLSQSTTLFMDGTFKAAPRLFSQLYWVHAVYREHVVPVLYCLLPDKSRATYHRMFDIVRGKMAALNLPLNPQIIMSDFESGISIFNKRHLNNYASKLACLP